MCTTVLAPLFFIPRQLSLTPSVVLLEDSFLISSSHLKMHIGFCSSKDPGYHVKFVWPWDLSFNENYGYIKAETIKLFERCITFCETTLIYNILVMTPKPWTTKLENGYFRLWKWKTTILQRVPWRKWKLRLEMDKELRSFTTLSEDQFRSQHPYWATPLLASISTPVNTRTHIHTWKKYF